MNENEDPEVGYEPNGDLLAPKHRSYSLAEALNCHDFDLYLQEDDPGSNSTTALTPKGDKSKYGNTLKMLLPWRPGKPKDPTICPVDHSGFFCLLFYRWMNPILSKAYRSPLQTSDVWACPENETSRKNTDRFERLWNEEVEANGKNASLTRVVWRFVFTRSVIAMILMSLGQFCEFLGVALALRYILEYIENSMTDLYYGCALAAGLFLGAFLRSCFVSFVWLLSVRTGCRLRSAVLSLLFKKVLRVRNMKDKSAGEIVNICAADGQRIMDSCVFVVIPMATPFLAVTCIIYAIILVGPAALLGTAVFILFIPMQITLGKLTAKLRERVIDVTNKRVRMISEMVQCIKLIKMYAWEKSFAKVIAGIRAKERKLLEKAGFVQIVSMGTSPMVSLLASVTTLTLHTLTGNDITVSKAFTLTAIFDVMRFLIISTPFAIKSLVETKVSIGRIQEILHMKETEAIAGRPEDQGQAIVINQASFTWDVLESENNNQVEEKDARKSLENGDLVQNEETSADKQPFLSTLSGIDLVVQKGQLVGICGAVGCGKTSFISAILNEMTLVEGDIAVDGSFAYASQQPWIINATVRDNIMFGNIYAREKYERAIEACCLTADLRILPSGDLTEIGERGINVSGGQKQRVSLARALYSDRDIYLLDDPLSAVDSHVGKHIFDNLIKEALKDKTVLFVTHQLQYLSECDTILVMDGGQIVERGTHSELMAMDNAYAQLIKTFHSDGEGEDENFPDNMPMSPEEAREVERQLSNGLAYSTTSLASVRTVDTEAPEDPDVTGKLISEEVKAEGLVSRRTYHGYVKAAGGYCLAIVIIIIFALTLGCVTFGIFWLSVWLRAGSGNTTITEGNVTYISNSLTDNPRLTFYTTIYGSSVVVMLVMILLKAAIYVKSVLRASSRLHANLFANIFRCPMSFFDTTPSGRILNRFAKDMDDLDVYLPIELDLQLQYNIAIILAVIAVIVVFPWLLIAVVPLGVFFVFVYQYFRHGVREMRRIEQVTRSPWFSHISASVQGVTTIYSYGKEKLFEKRFQNLLDITTMPIILCQTTARWAAIRLDIITALLMGCTGVLIVVNSGQMTAALAGLAIVCTSQITTYFQFCAKMNAEVEARFTSTERILEYTKNLPAEAPLTDEKQKPPPEWPSEGRLQFKDFKMRYRPNLPLVLKGISCAIQPMEKVGIVGRTGSGKSSLIVALFRLVESAAGKIIIDGVDIGKIGLHDLRGKLSIIPQDPVLFIGTVRYNLDPFEVHTDDELWSALEKAYMKENIANLPQQLEAPVIENGENFSVGERQLICMARALLRNSKILMLDEATAAIDTETDSLIQQTIRNSFQHCTMLTIAHRLNTVKNYDKIMVMDNGRIAEFDRPAVLMADKYSMFSAMLAAAESHPDA
ncbi:ATP-binding cassette sub-family C member 5-like [Ptychodera flava]|uniref:ATP-binding cassette sub-family C member 5-like n=1 Tax=Ptychodera flava TaxID=63121 RepID=UPI00396A6297